MTPEIIHTLLDYHYAELRKVWQDCVLQLDDQQYFHDLGYSHGSIHECLTHVLHAECWWLERARGRSPRSRLSGSDFPDRMALRARMDEVEAEVRAFAGALDAAGLAAPVQYSTPEGERIDNRVWHILLHIANHGLIHRAEIMAMSHRLGGPSFDLSLMRWLYDGRY